MYVPWNKTTHQDQNLYGGDLSSWGSCPGSIHGLDGIFMGHPPVYMYLTWTPVISGSSQNPSPSSLDGHLPGFKILLKLEDQN